MPPTCSRPGAHVDEVPAGPRMIECVPTSIAAFVGPTSSGPVNQPVRIFNFADFTGAFASADADWDMCEAVRLFFANGGSEAVVVRVATAGASASADELIGTEDGRTGLFALDSVDLLNILVAPGQAHPVVQREMIAYAERRRAFAILDLPADVVTPAGAAAWVAANQSLRQPSAAIYFPRLKCQSPQGTRSCANSGAIAGVHARTDATRGVWKPAAGHDAVINGAAGLEAPMSDEQNGMLNSLGVNALRSFPHRGGTVVWGARTLVGADSLASEWKYVPVRRLALFVEESIARGTRWAAFEPNEEMLWNRIRHIVAAFLHELFLDGAFAGSTPRETYFVQCDSKTTTSADLEAGVVNIHVGFAPLKPAEFIVIILRVVAGQR